MDMDKIGRAIRARRAALALTLRDAAPRCGMSYQMLGVIENGGNTTVERLQQVATGLNTTLDELLSGTQAALPDDRQPVLDRFARILPHIPEDELDVFIHELALWERRYAPTE